MPQADAQDWDMGRQFANHVDRAPRLFGAFRTGRDDDRLGAQAAATIDIDLVAAYDERLTIEPPKISGQVVNERIVIV